MAEPSNANSSDMHPAAAVFLNVIAGEISKENECLREQSERLKPLLNHIQHVEVMGAVKVEDGTKYQSIATAQLSEGTTVKHGDDKKLTIPIMSSYDILLKDLHFGGGISVHMAGHRLGHFPCTCFGNVADYTVVDIDEDDTAYLTLYVSKNVSIYGKLNGLTSDDISKLREDDGHHLISQFAFSNFAIQLGIEEETDASSPTFTPSVIAMSLSVNLLRRRLQYIGERGVLSKDGSEFEDRTPTEELRHLVMTALGDDDHRKLLKENNMLKRQRDALMNIRDMVLGVTILHRDGMASFSLEEGALENENEEEWVIKVKDSENTSIPVQHIKQSAFFLSGMHLNTPGNFLMPDQRFTILQSENNHLVGLRIPYAYGVQVTGVFNWADLSDDELSSILDNFHVKLQAATSPMTLMQDGLPIPEFPLSFKLSVVEVRFSQSSIEHTLKMVGLCEELALIDDAAFHE